MLETVNKTDETLPHYIGKIHPNCDYHHGQISPCIGACCFGVVRANRKYKDLDDGTGFTYKHAADIGYFNEKFYIQYLVNEKDEHTGAGMSVLASSKNGIDWDDFLISFPEYKIPKCKVDDYLGNSYSFSGETYAYMHQRMSFYKATNGVFLTLGFYGYSPKPYICNWDNYGIGRCVREIKKDGTLGEIYFIRYNKQSGFTEDLLLYPLYNQSKNNDFVNACNELLNNKLYTQQWAEEHGDYDELINIKHNGSSNQAFNFYHINDTKVVGLWKHSKAAISYDGGENFGEIKRVPSLVMSGQKVFAQKIEDNKFAMVYVPTLETQHRYPMCITTSNDGIKYDNMLLIHGEVPPMKYEGFWKDFGPQYMHGITEGNDFPYDNYIWLSYSVNKEDIFVCRIPKDIKGEELNCINDNFSKDIDILPKSWNIYSPKWGKVALENENNKNALVLYNKDPYDYSKVERVFKEDIIKNIEFSITPNQNDFGVLVAEIMDKKGKVALRLLFRNDKKIYLRTTTEIPLMDYTKDTEYKINISLNCSTFYYTLTVNDICFSDKPYIFMNAVDNVNRFSLKTGETRYYPTLDTRPEDVANTIKGCEEMLSEFSYSINYLIVD